MVNMINTYSNLYYNNNSNSDNNNNGEGEENNQNNNNNNVNNNVNNQNNQNDNNQSVNSNESQEINTNHNNNQQQQDNNNVNNDVNNNNVNNHQNSQTNNNNNQNSNNNINIPNTIHNNGVFKAIQLDTPTSGICTVTISNFSTYKESFYTGIFNLCASNWRLLIFPEGNNSPGNISIFLDYYDIGVNPLYQKEAQLSLTLINQLDSSKSVKKNSSHNFSFKGVNWGFIAFLPLSQLLNPSNGFLVKDQLKIRVEITSQETIDKSDPTEVKPYGKFSYKLTNVSHHFENFYSPAYHICGSNWRIYIFPNGYSSPNYFSVYLDLLDVKFKPLLVKHLFFAIEIVNQKNPEKNLKKWVDHVFDDKNMNFGFPKFVLLGTLLNQDLGYIVDDCIVINIEFTVMSSNFTESSPNFDIEHNLREVNPDCGRFTFTAKKQSNLDLVFSPLFRIAGCNWQLVSYPLENLTDYFSIYLDLVDIKTKPLLRKHISFAIEIVNQDNPFKSFKKYISNIYSYSSFSWLFQKFMKQTTLFKPENGFFKNGEIIINVELIVIASDFLKPIATTNLLSPPLFNINSHGKYQLPTLQPQPPPTPKIILDPLSESIVNTNTSSSLQSNGLQQLIITEECFLNRGEKTGSFSLTMENFLLLEKSFYSPVFTLFDSKWRFYVFPRGNQASGFFSLYLDYVDPKTKPKTRQYICFVLEVMNKDKKKSEKKYSFHTFCYSSVNWGFKKFLPLETIKRDDSGFLDQGTLTVSVTIFFLSQNILDNDHLFSYSKETSKHIQMYSKYNNNFNSISNSVGSVNSLSSSGGSGSGSNSTSNVNSSSSINNGGSNSGSNINITSFNNHEQPYPHHQQTIINGGGGNVQRFSDDAALNEQLKKQKAEEEAFYYHSIKLTFDQDYDKQILGGFEMIDFQKHIPIKIRKISTLLEIKLQIQMLYAIPFEKQRFWFWDPSPTKASRVNRCPMVLDDEDIFNQYLTLHPGQEIRFHLEISNSPTPNEKNLFFDQINNDMIMVFFKYYDPQSSKLSFITSKVCNINQPVSYFVPMINQKLGNPVNTPLLLFGEDALNVVYSLDPHKSLKYHEISNGSLIICQKLLTTSDRHLRFPFLTDYFNFTFNKLVVTFHIMHYKNINTQLDLTIKMEILKGMKYNEIVNRLSEIIQTFPQNILLYSIDKVDQPVEKKLMHSLVFADKSVYDTLTVQLKRVDIIYLEVKETILPIKYLSAIDSSRVFPLFSSNNNNITINNQQ